MNHSRQFYYLIGFAMLISLGSAGGQSPNIVLIMADDMGWGDTSYNGNQIIKTPGLDAMAKNGMRFNRFYAAAPVCSPTRGSCLTGRHPFRYGIFFANTGHLPSEEVTIAEYLKSKGYLTGHFGKWHLGTLSKNLRDSNRGGAQSRDHFSPPGQTGFDVNFSTEAKTPTYDPMIKPEKAGSKFWFPVKDRELVKPYGTRYWQGGQEVKQGLDGDDSKLIMDQAIQFIERSQNRKFLSVIWFHAPHLPVVASDEDRKEFEKLDPYSQSYFGCLKALDREVGRLRTRLRQLDIAENTLVCFCSDNGPEGKNSAPGSAGKLRGRKRSLYEGGVRVPGIVEWPKKINPGSVTEFPAVTSDYFPTIVELTEGKLPSRPFDGTSLAAVFQNPLLERKEPIFFESGHSATMLRQNFKLVTLVNRKTTEFSRRELYDLREDPMEKNNLASQSSQRVQRMESALKAWRASCRESLTGKDY
ncbi:MAG: sulfatase-like hydrolase/transferase [Planctomycetota bacterium]|nr:sulfatase-like hydrolase/transferase [Planctomycetota bacterium]